VHADLCYSLRILCRTGKSTLYDMICALVPSTLNWRREMWERWLHQGDPLTARHVAKFDGTHFSQEALVNFIQVVCGSDIAIRWPAVRQIVRHTDRGNLVVYFDAANLRWMGASSESFASTVMKLVETTARVVQRMPPVPVLGDRDLMVPENLVIKRRPRVNLERHPGWAVLKRHNPVAVSPSARIPKEGVINEAALLE